MISFKFEYPNFSLKIELSYLKIRLKNIFEYAIQKTFYYRRNFSNHIVYTINRNAVHK